MQVAIQEVRRLQKFGVSADELEVYKAALLRDSQQMAEGVSNSQHKICCCCCFTQGASCMLLEPLVYSGRASNQRSMAERSPQAATEDRARQANKLCHILDT